MADIKTLASRLDDAACKAPAIAQLSHSAKFSLEDAYAIQKASIARRLARSERQVGIKMGFTSRAKMAQMGLSDMIWGRLTDGMLIEDGARRPSSATCIREWSPRSRSCSRNSSSALSHRCRRRRQWKASRRRSS